MRILRAMTLMGLVFFLLGLVTLRPASADTMSDHGPDEWEDPICRGLIHDYFLDNYQASDNAQYYSDGTRKLDESISIMQTMEAYRTHYAGDHPTEPVVPINQFRAELGRTLLTMVKQRNADPDYIRSVASYRRLVEDNKGR
ncbi:MAG: hypothetical protein P4L72_16955 [Parvibaculum sp.]|uniref:hypothetical protein n=1 Tax=Parvibaculum sp. TaxID=2024848 RepID=UPI00284A605D|nr:hypothetical protein [Parvibaculum sp.]MDR3500905.1 hypothetical protein [Parvibaculum sp.]